MKVIRSFKFLFYLFLIIAATYGAGRLYYKVTDGFAMGNIISDFSYNPNWETHTLDKKSKEQLDAILAQKFFYGGKGCQSYVFMSEDGQYVLKFVKYQRFRPQAWLDYLTFVPFVDPYRLRKIEKKKKKLEMLFESWKIAFDELQDETGLLYVHLNKGKDLNRQVTIYDKMGFEHQVNIDQMEFLVQKRASMLCPSITALMDQKDEDGARKLLDRLLGMVLSEYNRGLADNDHALMQNTGVYQGAPIHIDVGQFVHNEQIKNHDVYKQELFSKTFKFRKWLKKNYPSLETYLDDQLLKIVGEDFYTLKPQVKNHAWSDP